MRKQEAWVLGFVIEKNVLTWLLEMIFQGDRNDLILTTI